jgi:hypothetical protein
VLADQMLALWQRLQATSWAQVFAPHNVPDDVGLWPAQDLAVDRSRAGFEDFAPGARRAVQPGDPAHSLIYHALASPHVHPPGQDWYPSLADLDLVENYIYSLAPLAPEEIRDRELVPAVFAYEYRNRGKTTHRRHADLVFSRTGIARLGSLPLRWDARSRSFTNRGDDPRQFAVMPARYAVFLARRVTGGNGAVSVMGPAQHGDGDRSFLLPVHKLFAGPECIRGCDLGIEFAEAHVNEKLRRLAKSGRIALAPGLDVERAPFIRRSNSTPAAPAAADERLVDIAAEGSSVTVGPPPAPLVRLARQRPAGGGQEIVATFEVEPQTSIIPDLRPNRTYTTLLVIDRPLKAALDEVVTFVTGRQHKIRPRNVPEFASIRHRLENPADPDAVEFLGDVIAKRAEFVETVSKGRYPAALYEDSICEGAVGATIAGLPQDGIARPAYSLVTAPDFFPLADAMDLEEWIWKGAGGDPSRQFREGSPQPLCFGRFAVNPAVAHPCGDGAAFDREDGTMVAVVGRAVPEVGAPVAPGLRQGTSFLTDAASNEFAPGWDVSFANDGDGPFYATYGLGSPFPEDTKLCAAANAYWPAASPDASRTFRRAKTPTAIPLLDEELGYHPNHPRVRAGEVPASRGWDGEYGPYLEMLADGRRCVNYADIFRSDYVANAQRGHFDASRLIHVDSRELIRRMACLGLCIAHLPSQPRGGLLASLFGKKEKTVANTRLWLVSAERRDFDDPGQVPCAPLQGGGQGYRFQLVELPEGLDDKDVEEDPTAAARLRQSFASPVYTCYVGNPGLCWQADDSPLEFRPAPPGQILP